jgi:hypothetical protein
MLPQRDGIHADLVSQHTLGDNVANNLGKGQGKSVCIVGNVTESVETELNIHHGVSTFLPSGKSYHCALKKNPAATLLAPQA